MASEKNILILGGYGQTGIQLAKLLLKKSRHNICLAGRDQVKADREARTLNWEHSCDRVRGVQVNLGLKRQLTGIMEDYDLVIDNIGETAFIDQAARAALDPRGPLRRSWCPAPGDPLPHPQRWRQACGCGGEDRLG